MTYISNPKLKGSGVLGCIPQTGTCPNNCADCFFQSGRSYLEPLGDNLPNLPPVELAATRIVRVNDGNDSNVRRDEVVAATACYPFRFFNTAIPKNLEQFPGPVVLTVNPGDMTDVSAHLLENVPPNLMFVRFRANTWNIRTLGLDVIGHYSEKEVPIVLTWMAYFDTAAGAIPHDHVPNYVFRKRTLNSYWAITTGAWERAMVDHRYNKWVYSCGKVEGERGTTACRHCGNCVREFFAAMERIGPQDGQRPL